MKNVLLAVGSAALLVFLPGAARADSIITFNVSGNAMAQDGQSCGSCAFSGTLTIDVTNGTPEAADITFPGLTAFDTVLDYYPYETSDEVLAAGNSSDDSLALAFTTTMTPGSLDGFDGGTIFYGLAFVPSSGNPLYSVDTGSITAPPVSATPEPASWVLLGTGLLGMLGMMRRKVLPS